ncbi:thioesterase family protein [Mycolicibacterium palauense]|uniref:thioesterase family protein n=1 Tax=Mycolicibacterium palauense TaxID=2034511 RepID=UPI000BFEC276|nr:thioesterase family protein [Mycolicibacterium palauense]
MPTASLTPFFVPDGDTFVPHEVAQGGWGPTLGGQVVGGLLARAVEGRRADPELVPARLTVDILRRVATEPVTVDAEVLRVGRRMQAIDAVMTQRGETVARASALYLRGGEQPPETPWSTPVSIPPLPAEPERFDTSVPMFIRAYGRDPDHGGGGFEWQHDGPRYAWLREIRALVDGEEISPFVRAAMAVDVTASMTNFTTAGLGFINADYTLTLCRLPEGPYIGLAALTHCSAGGVATGTAALFDTVGQIGAGVTTSVSNPHFAGTPARA